MKVRELIAQLSECDPDAPVWTIDTCECCTTFSELEAAHIGEQHLSKLRLTTPSTPFAPEVSDASAAWPKPLEVIAGGRWSRFPDWP